MGKTVPSYRLALEDEIAMWKSFRNALQTAKEREAFDVLMDLARGQAMAGGNACMPVLFDPMVMSILLGLQLQIRDLEYKVNDLIWKRICAQESQKTANANEENQAIRAEKT